MDKAQILYILQNSPSIELIKCRKSDFIIGFFVEVFSEKTSVSSNTIHDKLDIYLERDKELRKELDLDLDQDQEETGADNRRVGARDEFQNGFNDDFNQDFRGGTTSNLDQAKRLIQSWTNRGFLSNYQNEDGVIYYELSSHSAKVIDWIESLKKEAYIGTESKFKTLFNMLKELVEFTNEDRKKRLSILRKRKAEIEQQIKSLLAGEDVQVFEDYQIIPRYKEITRLAKDLASDFKEVDNNFKEIIRQTYLKQTEKIRKGEILDYVFDAYDDLKGSPQGKSFYAFWDFLLSQELQKQWEELLKTLFQKLEQKNIDVRDTFIRNMKQRLFYEGEKVYKTNDRMAEKLSRIIRQDTVTNTQATKNLINDIKKKLLELSQQQIKPDVGFYVEKIKVNLPMERTLTMTQTKDQVKAVRPQPSRLDMEDLVSFSKMVNPYQVDRNVLRKSIKRLLTDNRQLSLGELIQMNGGITKGLTEVFAYISLIIQMKHTVREGVEEAILYQRDPDKYILIPQIIVTV